MMHQDDEIYEDLYDEELDGMCEILVEAIHVDLDSGWNPGSTLSFYAHPYRNDAFHTIVNCQKSIQWTPDAPVEMQDDIRMEYRTGSHHVDATMSWNEIWQLAKNAAYRHRKAHIKIEKAHSFGTSIVWVMVREHITFWDAPWRMCVAIEFGSSEDCVNFIQYGSRRLEHRSIDATRVRYAWRDGQYVVVNMPRSPYENGRTVIDDIHHAVYQAIPFGLDHSAAQSDAIDRGLSRSEFMEESATSSLETTISRRSHTPSPRNSQSCVLLVDLYIETYVSLRREIDSFISRVVVQPTPRPSAFPSNSDSFRSLNDFNIHFTTTYNNRGNDDSPMNSPPRDGGSLTINISAQQISFLQGTNSMRSGNSFTVDSEHRTVIINYIVGDAFFGSIHGGNIGGRNNVNHIQEIHV